MWKVYSIGAWMCPSMMGAMPPVPPPSMDRIERDLGSILRNRFGRIWSNLHNFVQGAPKNAEIPPIFKAIFLPPSLLLNKSCFIQKPLKMS
jgi:hypothetical protein